MAHRDKYSHCSISSYDTEQQELLDAATGATRGGGNDSGTGAGQAVQRRWSEAHVTLTRLQDAAAAAAPRAPPGEKRLASEPEALAQTFTSPCSPHTASLAASALNTTRSLVTASMLSLASTWASLLRILLRRF